MSELASETSRAAQEEVTEIEADPDQDDGIGAPAGRHAIADRAEPREDDDAVGQGPTPTA